MIDPLFYDPDYRIKRENNPQLIRVIRHEQRRFTKGTFTFYWGAIYDIHGILYYNYYYQQDLYQDSEKEYKHVLTDVYVEKWVI